MNTNIDFNKNRINLNDFIGDFHDSLMENLNKTNKPVYTKESDMSLERQSIMESFKRRPYSAQANVVQAITKLLIDCDEPAAIINAEMGTGKSLMGIAVAAILHHEISFRRHLIISPPHLVYKWRREILETLPEARVWILNGADTLLKLLKLREELNLGIESNVPEFYIMGRVRMRMGFNWKLAFKSKPVYPKDHFHDENGEVKTAYIKKEYAACPHCFNVIHNNVGEPLPTQYFIDLKSRVKCSKCGSPLWQLIRPSNKSNLSLRDRLIKSLCEIPTIGEVKAKSLIEQFGEEFLSNMLSDNFSDFVNIMNENGDFIFTDKQARRITNALTKLELGFNDGSYQATEFIKRYLPQGFFDFMIVDECHEYKNQGSAQGQALGVIASKVKKILLLTGTLMGGYADDLFFLLFRALTSKMIEDGYRPNSKGSLSSAALSFMRDHGIVKDIYIEVPGQNHKTANGKNIKHRTTKAPGFGPKGILRYVVPYTAFLTLKDLGNNVLPKYKEEYIEVPMTYEQRKHYDELSIDLKEKLTKALRNRDVTLLGVVLNTLLAWPDCCFRPEVVKHPRTRQTLVSVPSIFSDVQDQDGNNVIELSPKERQLVEFCIAEKARGRKVLVYSIYTNTRDTTNRLKRILELFDLKTAVLKSNASASVSPVKREDWFQDKVDRGYEVIITNPELVKTGLDLLDFPTIIFLQTGFNVYTLQQAAKRSYRIGQKKDVKVIYLGYEDSAQTSCLQLMAKKIAVSQSTSGNMPESGLDVLNDNGDSVEMALAKQLIES